LAQRRYFDNPAFANFLVYLRYWKKPEYVRFNRYPQCLAFLDVLTEGSDFSKRFIEEMCKPGYQAFVHEQVFRAWQFAGTNRLRELYEAPTAAEVQRASKVAKVRHDAGDKAGDRVAGDQEEAAGNEPTGGAAAVEAWGDGPSRFAEARLPLARTDAAGTDAAGTDAAGTDAAGTDAAGTDAAGSDAAGTDAAAAAGAQGTAAPE
jgi:mediator of RNA polymerase II transcription subunit 31